jgi:hypothetical protein
MPDPQVSNYCAVISVRCDESSKLEADAAEPNGHVVLSNNKREDEDSCRDTHPNAAKKQKRSTDLDPIGLEDVPPQTPILKNNDQ